MSNPYSRIGFIDMLTSAPDARYVSIRRLDGSISISTSSSISGETKTDEKEVWRRAPESNGLFELTDEYQTLFSTSRSVLTLYVNSSTLIPATSPSDTSTTSA